MKAGTRIARMGQMARIGGWGSGLKDEDRPAAGTFAVQLAKALGAEVTGVSSGANAALVRSLGAQHAVDYTKEDFAVNGEQYDLICDAVGKASARRARRALKPGGVYVSVAAATRENPADLNTLRALAEAGAIRAVIDRCYPLAQTAEAHRYVETGRKRGSVVFSVP